MKFWHVVFTVVCGLLLVACSRPDKSSIVGHWRAERETFFSVHLPVGPDIVINDRSISVPGTGASIPLSSIGQRGDEIILEMPYGVGVSFYFDGPDRIYFNAPMFGKVYYQRVKDDATVRAMARSNTNAKPVTPVSASPASQVLAVSSASVGLPRPAGHLSPLAPGEAAAHPSADFDLAVLAARQGNRDLAIDRLNEAFKQGFRSIDRIESSPDFVALRSDVRYQALLARYR